MTSTTPAALMWPVIILLIGAAGTRALVLENSAFNRRLNVSLAFMGMVALTRAPAFQGFVEPVLPQLAVLRPVTHMFAMLAGASIFGLMITWSGRSEPQRRQTLLYLGVVVLVVGMFFLSQPSRDAGVTLEEYGTWRALVYHIFYSTPLLIAYGTIVVIVVRDWSTTITVRGKVCSVVAFVLCSVSLFDNLFRPFAAIFEMQHIRNSITEMRSESNDLLFLPTVAILAVLTLWPAVQRLIEWFPSAHHQALYERLEPLWETVTAAVPAVVLRNRVGEAVTPRQRLWRRVVEIRDGLLVLNNYTADLSAKVIDEQVTECSTSPEHDQGLRRAITLHSSIHARDAGTASTPGASVHHDTELPHGLDGEARELGFIADNWKLAGNIAQELYAERARTAKYAHVAGVE